MTSLAEAFGLGRGCFGREGVLRCTGTFPETGGSELLRFLAHVRADPALRQMMADALTADEVSLLAQKRGFLVSGSDILRFHGQSASGIRISRIDHPGEYPGRYY